MDFVFKDFEQYYQSELNSSFQKDKSKTINYAFIHDDYVLVMRKCRKYWQVVQSAKCGFEPMFHFSTFDLLYHNESKEDVMNMYFSYLERLIGVINNGLHKSI